MFGGVKITLIISLTILTSCVLLISYNEYTNRYYVIGNNDNSIYIFDKKSAVLNKCGEKGCQVIETRLPTLSPMGITQGFTPSKMFESDKPMTKDAIAKIDAVEAKSESLTSPESKTSFNAKEASESISLDKKSETVDAKKENSESKSTEDKKSEGQKETLKSEEEFVE
ncbi:MAG: hypothetical protein LBM19_01615 [Holosporales bacterium]|jgi:hypothetical protein|nr:hypothetical protein [Holosporales bacterium]